MTKTNSITEKRTHIHLTDIQRGKLEQLAKIGTYTQKKMACELGVSQATVSRELKRGRTRQLDYQRNYSEQYIAASGARVYQENRSNSHTQDYEKYSAAVLPIRNIDLPMKNRMRPRKKTVSGAKGAQCQTLGPKYRRASTRGALAGGVWAPGS